MGLLDAFAEQMGLCDALAEIFQKAMATLQNALDEFLPENKRNNFHGSQPFTGMRDVRTQSLNVISEHLAAFASA